MRQYILCGKPTTGSIGRTGIVWACVCQTCKDREDQAALSQLRCMSDGLRLVEVAMKTPQTLRECATGWGESTESSVN